jgi:hypothetical protein
MYIYIYRQYLCIYIYNVCVDSSEFWLLLCLFASFTGASCYVKVTFEKKPFGILRYQPGKVCVDAKDLTVGCLSG